MDETTKEKEIQEGKFFAVISYISFLCIIGLVLKKDNKFALYHAKQGLVLFVFEVACLFLSVIPKLGGLIQNVGMIILLWVSFWAAWQALVGKYFRIPWVANIADKIVL